MLHKRNKRLSVEKPSYSSFVSLQQSTESLEVPAESELDIVFDFEQGLSTFKPRMVHRSRAASVSVDNVIHTRIRTLSVADARLFPTQSASPNDIPRGSLELLNFPSSMKIDYRGKSSNPLQSQKIYRNLPFFSSISFQETKELNPGMVKPAAPEDMQTLLAAAGIMMYEKEEADKEAVAALPSVPTNGIAGRRQKREWELFEWNSLLPQKALPESIAPPAVKHTVRANTSRKRDTFAKVSLVNMNDRDPDVLYPHTSFKYIDLKENVPILPMKQDVPSPMEKSVARKHFSRRVSRPNSSRPSTGQLKFTGAIKSYTPPAIPEHRLSPFIPKIQIAQPSPNPSIRLPKHPLVTKRILEFPTLGKSTVPPRTKKVPQIHLGQKVGNTYLFVPRSSVDPFNVKKAHQMVRSYLIRGLEIKEYH